MVQFHFLDDDDGDATSSALHRRAAGQDVARALDAGVHGGIVSQMRRGLNDNTHTHKHDHDNFEMVSVPFLPVRLPSATKPAFLTTGPGPQTWLTDHSCYEASLRRPRCSRVHPNHHLCFRPPLSRFPFPFLSLLDCVILFRCDNPKIDPS